MATYAKQVDFLNVPQFDPTTNLRYQNGYVKVLLAGTSTEATVYTSRDKSTTTTNPFALDADDTKEIFLDGIFDIELYEGDPDDVDNPGVKRDTISGYEALIGNPGSVVNVSLADYSAVGDGVADDTAAIQAALDDIGSGAGKLYVSGMYKITSELTSTASYLSFVGDDPQNSGFLCTGCNWLALTQSHKYDGFRFENIAVLTDSVPTYTGLTYVGAASTGDALQRIIRNCLFAGKDRFYDLSGNTEGWLKAVTFNQGDKVYILDTFLQGPEEDRLNSFPNASYGVYAENCTHLHILNCHIFIFDTGIYCDGQSEALNIVTSNLVANNKGVNINTGTDPSNDHNIINTHISSFTYNISLDTSNLTNSFLHNIRGCLLFKRPDAAGAFRHIVSNANSSQITDNYFYQAPAVYNAGDIGIDIESGKNILVAGNIFFAVATCVKFASGVDRNMIINNRTIDPVAALSTTNPIIDNGATNLTYWGNTTERGNTAYNPWINSTRYNTQYFDIDGGGSYVFRNDGADVFQIPEIVGDPVNYMSFIPSATGDPCIIRVADLSSDTDVDIRLFPKGTGKLRFGTHAAIGAETVTGYITIKDSNGTERKIAVVS